jgi:hypothetical protein
VFALLIQLFKRVKLSNRRRGGRERVCVCSSLSASFVQMPVVGLQLLKVGDTASSINAAIWLSSFFRPPFASDASHSSPAAGRPDPVFLLPITERILSKQLLQPSLLSPPSPLSQIAIFVHRKTNSAPLVSTLPLLAPVSSYHSLTWPAISCTESRGGQEQTTERHRCLLVWPGCMSAPLLLTPEEQ